MQRLIDAAGLKKLAYVVLAHEGAELVAAHANMLLAADPTGQVVVHYDGSAAGKDFERLRTALAASPRGWLVPDPVKCAWGNFTLVEAVVRALRLIRDQRLDCDYVFLLSCSCVPIKPIAKLKRFLAMHEGQEFIEAASPAWIKDGLREERYSKYHWFSWRTHRWLFDASVVVQRKLGISRRVPSGLSVRFGSQWWCLTRKTCDGILEFIDQRPRDYEFFRRSWIPDEMFFQTVATFLAGEQRIAGKNLTFFMFGTKGRPVPFYDDQCDSIVELPFFFARKISSSATRLREFTATVAAGPDDGGSMPSLDQKGAIAKYHRDVGRSVNFARPGQSFYAWQIYSGWPSSLGAYPGIYCVLYGPPALTRMVRQQLERAADVTVLGRLFHPEKVELCARGEEFGGFSADDHKIRDFDRPLYLSRLLQRCRGLPILEMAPGDGEFAERYFHQAGKVLFLSCVPANINDADMRRLYWLLVAADAPDLPSVASVEPASADSIEALRAEVDVYLERTLKSKHRKWVNEVISGANRTDRFFSIFWNPEEGPHVPYEKGAAERAIQAFGAAVTPAIDFLASIEPEFRSERSPVPGERAAEAMLLSYAQALMGAPRRAPGAAPAGAGGRD